MALPPVTECARERDNKTVQGPIIHDYTDNSTLCRRGVWVGMMSTYQETVALCWEHDPEPLNVFWGLQHGGQILYPGQGARLTGPVNGAPGVHYIWPYQNRQHRIAFVCAPGTTATQIHAKVLYQRHPGPEVHTDGPETTITISGRVIAWPQHKLEEERECKQRWSEVLRRYVRWREPLPGQTVMGLDDIRGPRALELNAMIKELERLGPDADRELVQGIEAELTSRLLAAELRELSRSINSLSIVD